MKITPRPYQVECVDAIYDYFGHSSGNPLCALPTGTGKSVIIAMFLESIFKQYANQRVLVVTHVKELIAQNYGKLKELWPSAPAGIYSAGLNRRDTTHSIVFAGVSSIAKKYKSFNRVDLILIDEAHLVSPNDSTQYQKLITGLRAANPYLKVIGFTATPWRLGQGALTDSGIFTDICYDLTKLEAFNRLIAEGYLVRLIPKKTATLIDTDSLHVRAGEFVQAEVQMAVDKDVITKAALREAALLGSDRKHWLIFATGVQHAENIAYAMQEMGLTCEAVHSKMPDEQRDRIIRDFKAGKILAVANVGVLTTGFDFPAIDMIIMLRPTMSPVLWVQMLGRGTRPFKCEEYVKTDCLVLDFAGNTKRLGPVNDPVVPRKKGSKGGEAPVKLCDTCGAYSHASVRFCEHCGTEFTFVTKIKQTASTNELVKEDLPIVETFKIDQITYAAHHKIDKPVSLKVSYFCGLRMFNDYVCFEHSGFARRKAEQWWRERVTLIDNYVPVTVEEVLEATELLKVPTHVNVWLNKQYPEILGFDYSGTAFGKENVCTPDAL